MIDWMHNSGARDHTGIADTVMILALYAYGPYARLSAALASRTAASDDLMMLAYGR